REIPSDECLCFVGEYDFMNGRLQDKVCLITGAGSGMGRTASLLFAEEGARVVAADMNGAAAGETTSLVTAAKGKAVAVQADVSSEKDAKRMAAEAVKAFGALHVLYNN